MSSFENNNRAALVHLRFSYFSARHDTGESWWEMSRPNRGEIGRDTLEKVNDSFMLLCFETTTHSPPPPAVPDTLSNLGQSAVVRPERSSWLKAHTNTGSGRPNKSRFSSFTLQELARTHTRARGVELVRQRWWLTAVTGFGHRRPQQQAAAISWADGNRRLAG